MANQKEIRSRIKSVKTTQQLTRAMKMVAAAKLRRAQDGILRLRPYAGKLSEIIGDVTSGMSEDIESPYIKARPVETVLIVVVTSNRGLCGGFNGNLLKVAINHIQDNYSKHKESGKLEILAIGKKGFEFFGRRKFKLSGGNHDLFTGLSFKTTSDLAETVMNGFVAGTWDRVDLIYNEFRNVMSQNKKVDQFLPLASVKSVAGTNPTRMTDFIFEPGKKEILEDLIPRSLKMKFYKAVLESNASEQGARMTAMDTATENADEILKALKLEYNRARQATITKEILEIVGGAEALASGG